MRERWTALIFSSSVAVESPLCCCILCDDYLSSASVSLILTNCLVLYNFFLPVWFMMLLSYTSWIPAKHKCYPTDINTISLLSPSLLQYCTFGIRCQTLQNRALLILRTINSSCLIFLFCLFVILDSGYQKYIFARHLWSLFACFFHNRLRMR